jgi:hypothetical protein
MTCLVASGRAEEADLSGHYLHFVLVEWMELDPGQKSEKYLQDSHRSNRRLIVIGSRRTKASMTKIMSTLAQSSCFNNVWTGGNNGNVESNAATTVVLDQPKLQHVQSIRITGSRSMRSPLI